MTKICNRYDTVICFTIITGKTIHKNAIPSSSGPQVDKHWAPAKTFVLN